MTNPIPLKGYYDISGNLISIGEIANNETVSLSSLGTGTANSNTYLSGDGTWKIITQAAATTSVAGLVQLNDTINSNSTSLAATANAVKTAYDLANTANINAANASFLTVGTVSTARLGSGTANSTTYLAGDNSWKSIPPTVSITNDTTSENTLYPMLSTSTTGTLATANTSSTKLYYNPSTGTLSATTFSSLSDESLKENVIPLINSIDILRQLQPVSFTWKDNGKKSYGLIAQEVEKVIPELVDDNNGIKTINYSALIAFLIDAVVDQKNNCI